jgi:hypothetical protein
MRTHPKNQVTHVDRVPEDAIDLLRAPALFGVGGAVYAGLRWGTKVRDHQVPLTGTGVQSVNGRRRNGEGGSRALLKLKNS